MEHINAFEKVAKIRCKKASEKHVKWMANMKRWNDLFDFILKVTVAVTACNFMNWVFTR